MSEYQDFGFNSEEYSGSLTTVPYAQFLNASSKNYGLAITSANAELAEFQPNENWQLVEHEFSDGEPQTLLLTRNPRLLVVNRSKPLMSDGREILPYDRATVELGEYKAFSYLVVWFLDEENQPLSKFPFRLKCSGFSGITLIKNYSYYNNSESFCKKFLQVYKSLTGDKAVEKNNIFYAHAVYQPNLIRNKVTSSVNGQSSYAVVTESFVLPTKENFASLIIKNDSKVSQTIKELVETTKPWLKAESIETELESANQEEPQPTAEPKIPVAKDSMAEDSELDLIPF